MESVSISEPQAENSAEISGVAGLQNIGLIAGEGGFPFLLAKAARERGIQVTALGIQGITPPELETEVAAMHWIEFLQFGQLIQQCHDAGISKTILAGRIQHNAMFQMNKIDERGMRLLMGARSQRADAILGAITAELALENIEVLDSTMLLRDCIPSAGLLTPECPPSDKVKADIAFGKPLVEALASHDIGQTMIVKARSVVAVEAMEGTNSAIERAGQIAGKGCVMLKVNKPNQDRRFDVPVIGLTTIEKLAAAGCAALAIPGDQVLFFDQDAALALANKSGISIVAW